MMTTLKILMKSAVLLVWAGIFDSCKADQTTEIRPVSFVKEDPIHVFFEQVTVSECFFVEVYSDTCIVINNTDELMNQMSCSIDTVPNIDFETQTLIIGQHQMPQMYYKVVEQHIVETATLLEVNLTVQRSEGTYEAFSTMYYWGIYPKLPNRKIEIKIINY